MNSNSYFAKQTFMLRTLLLKIMFRFAVCHFTLISGTGIKHNLTSCFPQRLGNLGQGKKKKKRQNIANLHLADLKVCHEEDNSHIAQSTA